MSDCCLTVYAKSPGLAMVPGKNRAIHARGATALCNCFVDKLLELKLSCGGGRKSRAYSLIFRYPLCHPERSVEGPLRLCDSRVYARKPLVTPFEMTNAGGGNSLKQSPQPEQTRGPSTRMRICLAHRRSG